MVDALAAIEAAVRVGQRRAEMVAQHAAFLCRHALVEFAPAFVHAERAVALARQLGAPRFIAEGLAFRAELHNQAGRGVDAREDVNEALAIARRTGMAFIGPIIRATLARVTDDAGVREEALEEAEALLAAGSAAHNQLMFRRSGTTKHGMSQM